MIQNKEKSLFLKCDCSTHTFECERVVEYWGDGQPEETFNLTFWSCGRNDQTLSWRERWRWIWNILRTGSPWSDGIIIDNEQAKEIVNYINKHLPKE